MLIVLQTWPMCCRWGSRACHKCQGDVRIIVAERPNVIATIASIDIFATVKF